VTNPEVSTGPRSIEVFMHENPSGQIHRSRRTGLRLAISVVAVTAAMVVVPACGFEISKSSDSDKSQTTSTTMAPLTTAQMQSALLALPDMPPGWSTDPSPSSDGGTGGGTDALCPAGSSAARASEHDAVEIEFTQTLMGPFVYQSLISAPDAESHLAELRTAFDTCVGQTWSADMGGEMMTLSLAEVSTTPVGDSTVGYRLTGSGSISGTAEMVGLTADFVLVRNDTVIEMYAGMSVNTTLGGETLSPTEFSSIIETGNGKVQRIASEGFRA
jgi:hypothetical protein